MLFTNDRPTIDMPIAKQMPKLRIIPLINKIVAQTEINH